MIWDVVRKEEVSDVSFQILGRTVVKNRIEMNSPPNLIIAGVNKAGSTSLFSYLSAHPQVCSSAVKETCYFLPIRYGKPIAPLSEYLLNFDNQAGRPVVMEATPGYFYGGKPLALALNAVAPDARVILLFRNPVSRLISFFRFMQSMLLLDESLTLEEYIEECKGRSVTELRVQENNPYFGVEGGFYSNYLMDWFEVFGDRLKIIFFEDVKGNPHEVLRDVSTWLEIDPDFYTRFDFRAENRTSAFRSRNIHMSAIAINKHFEKGFRRFPIAKKLVKSVYSLLNLSSPRKEVSPGTRALLEEMYRDSNDSLKEMLRHHGVENWPDWLRDIRE